MSDTESRIRERAHQLWEAAGRPHDRSDEFWRAAEREVAEMAEQGGGFVEPATPTDKLGEATYDKALADSFPASDPPGNTGITGPEDVMPPAATPEAVKDKTKAKGMKTTGNEPVAADPGGTKPTQKPGKSGKKGGGGSKQTVRSGDRNDATPRLN